MFAATYFPEDLVLITPDMINCDSTEYKNEEELYIHDDEGSYIYNINNGKMKRDMVESGFNSEYQLEAFNYAKQLVLKDLEEYRNNHNETLINEKEGNGCLNHYFDYEINFNDKTYKKVN